MVTPTYQPGIPTGRVNLNVDYQNIQGNFSRADTSFGTDHVAFSVNTPENGYHTAIHFNPISTIATNGPNNYPPDGYTVVPGIGQLFGAQINDGNGIDTALFSLTGNGILTQLTSNFAPNPVANNGTTFLPGGLILKWGRTAEVNTNVVVNFAPAFPNACFCVQVTRIRAANSPGGTFGYWVQNNFNAAGFTIINSDAHTYGNLWLAIGN
jgi:hypothetical protein